jgi:putative ABC transport system permease protein
VLSALVLVLAHGQNVPVAITPLGILACAVLVMGITLLSGLLAVRTLRNADPAKLLR